MFLITGVPRSGTHYTAQLLQKLGHSVVHEQVGGKGSVSWYHAAPKRFREREWSVVLHQVRHPLGVIGSLTTIKDESWALLEGVTGKCPSPDIVYRSAWTWLKWTEHCDEIAEWRFCVEDWPSQYAVILKRLRLAVPKVLPQLARTIATRPHVAVTWETLDGLDSQLCADVQSRAEAYGYG